MSDSLPNTKCPFFNMSTDPVLPGLRASGCSSSSHNLLRIQSFSSISKMRTRSVANIVLSVMPLKSTRREGLIHISYMQYIYIYMDIRIYMMCIHVLYIYIYIHTYYKRRISPDGNFQYDMGLPKMFNASCETCTEENNHDHKVTINF